MKYQHDTLGLLRRLQGPLFLSLEFVYLRIICLRLLLRSSLFSSEVLLKVNFHLVKDAFTNKIKCDLLVT